MDLFSFYVQTKSTELRSRDAKSVSPLVSLSPLGDQLFGLQLHLCSPFQGHIHQELEAAEVLCEVWRGGGRGVEEPAAGAQVALHAGAAEDGGSGGERLAARPFIPAPEQRLSLYGLQQLGRPLTVHSQRRGVGGCRAGLHCCGDSGVTDDRRPGGHEPWRGGRGGWGRYGGGHRLPQDAGHGRFEAGGVEDALVVALLCTCCGAAVFWRLGAVREAVTGLAAFPGDCELIWVFAIFPQHLWEKSPPRINEPVAHLQCGELSLLGQEGFLLLGWVSVVTVLVQPVPEDLNRLLGQIPSPLPLPVAPGAGRQIQGGVHAVFIVRLAARQHHQTFFRLHLRAKMSHLFLVRAQKKIFSFISPACIRISEEEGKIIQTLVVVVFLSFCVSPFLVFGDLRVT